MRSNLDALKRQLVNLQLEFNSICAKARNSYSKEQIKSNMRWVKGSEGQAKSQRGSF